MSREGISKDRAPKIPEQISIGFPEENKKSPQILKEKDFSFKLKDEADSIRQNEKIHLRNTFTFQNSALYLDGIPLEAWINERKEVIKVYGSKPECLIRQKGEWREDMVL